MSVRVLANALDNRPPLVWHWGGACHRGAPPLPGSEETGRLFICQRREGLLERGLPVLFRGSDEPEDCSMEPRDFGTSASCAFEPSWKFGLGSPLGALPRGEGTLCERRRDFWYLGGPTRVQDTAAPTQDTAAPSLPSLILMNRPVLLVSCIVGTALAFCGAQVSKKGQGAASLCVSGSRLPPRGVC